VTAALSQQAIDQFALRMRDDFLFYAPRALRLKPKQGGLYPFKPNFCQEYVHRVAEDQLKRTGKVRLIILKGRQQGMSTYIEGRFFWKTTHRFGIKAYILTHEAEATKSLFEMAFRYWENCPPEFRPAIDAGNAKELSFGTMDTKYSVGTAGAKGTGRSQNIHLFHGSEVAYWPHADDHSSGVMQAVGDFPGTEVWLESTASGPGDYFHRTWQGATEPGKEAQATSNDFIRVFIPWYWQEEYRMELKPGFVLDAEEVELMETYGLDFEQLQWRRTKIQDLGGDVSRFQRDYPMCPDEAFQNATVSTLIPTMLVVRARRRRGIEAYGPRILGVDVAREGNDRSVLALRQGRVVPLIEAYSNKDNMELVGLIVKAVREHGVDHIFCDGVGNGSGVIDRLRELGFGHMLTAIKGNHKPLDPVLYYNKRAECWGRMKVWLEEDDPQLPDDGDLQADLCGLTKSYDSTERLVLEKKSAAKKRGIKSPDKADALAFTFAQPVGASNHGSFEPEDMAA
jgi:hypothetical protein